jgi:hypothetical protein
VKFKISEIIDVIADEIEKVNPWAVCTASVGRKDKDKYERCIKAVKKQQGMD